MTPTPRKPGSWYKRQYIWRHNGLFGSVRMAESTMTTIANSTSTTYEAKRLAEEIHSKLSVLYRLLQTRIDPK